MLIPSSAASHKNAFPNESSAQARTEAFSIEANIFNQASSKVSLLSLQQDHGAQANFGVRKTIIENAGRR